MRAYVVNSSAFESHLLLKVTSNKDIKRLETLFKETPVISSDDFYAAKIMFQSTNHENINERNKNL